MWSELSLLVFSPQSAGQQSGNPKTERLPTKTLDKKKEAINNDDFHDTPLTLKNEVFLGWPST